MRITCLGAGPAGLYFSILMKRADPAHDITVIERNRRDDAYGWGVVFSDRTLDGFRDADAESHAAILGSFRRWDAIDIFFKDQHFRSLGHGFAGISRAALLHILQQRAAALGVRLQFEIEAGDPDHYAADCDLLVAADGVNSTTREK